MGFDVYQIDEPKAHNNAVFTLVEYRNKMTGVGCMSEISVTSYDENGEYIRDMSSFGMEKPGEHSSFKYSQPKAGV
ncbi:MAG: hypothetical protein AAF988_03265 [Pseudomonadota bacterium]